MSNRNYDELFEAYSKEFDEVFPLRMVHVDEEEVMDIIEECLKTGKPYNPMYEKDYDPEADY